jgi:CubicO group peptidase (beta-lactamase class C family)
VLERISGVPLDRLFARRVAVPLGLPRAGFASASGGFTDAAATERGNEYERALAGEAGAGHRWPTELLRGEVHDGNARALGGVAGHAGLFGTLEEVASIARVILRPGSLPLGDRTRRLLLRPAPPERTRTLGLEAAAASRAARGVLPGPAPGHTGFTGTSLWLDPGAGSIFVLLTNRVHPRVPEREFHPVRRGFHRLAVATLRGGRPAASHPRG